MLRFRRGGATLEEVRQWVLDNREEGVICPACGQTAKVYRRKIYKAMATALITVYRKSKMEWVHIPSTTNKGGRSASSDGTFAKLRYWGLVEEENVVRPDGGRAGWWRITRKGRAYMFGNEKVVKYARIYNGECLGLVGPEVTIDDAFKDPFDLRDLMDGV